jgi:hypothetical protein
MKTISIFIILLTLTILNTSCTKIKNTYEVDFAFQPYVEQYISEAHSRHIVINEENLIIKFDDGEQTGMQEGVFVNGRCIRNVGQVPIVYINRLQWSNYNYYDKVELIFHETTHCLLGQGHDDALLSNHIPKSIMNTYHLGSQIFNAQTYDYYVNELFTF